MELHEWMGLEIERLQRFQSVWERETANNPEQWPPVMNAGEWDEQYRAFETSDEG